MRLFALSGWLVAAGLLLLVVGCAHQVVWEKPGGSPAAFDADRYACLLDSKNGVGGYDDRLFNSCMALKGYVER